MARSVSTPRNTAVVVYAAINFEYEFAYDDFIINLTYELKNAFPSLDDCGEFLGREDLAILENKLAYIGVSGYCGLVSIWIAPKEGAENIGDTWAKRAEKTFKRVVKNVTGEIYYKAGTFSNGESIYQPYGAN